MWIMHQIAWIGSELRSYCCRLIHSNHRVFIRQSGTGDQFSGEESRQSAKIGSAPDLAPISVHVRPPIWLWYARRLAGRIAKTELIAWNLLSLRLQPVFLPSKGLFSSWFLIHSRAEVLDYESFVPCLLLPPDKWITFSFFSCHCRVLLHSFFCIWGYKQASSQLQSAVHLFLRLCRLSRMPPVNLVVSPPYLPSRWLFAIDKCELKLLLSQRRK